MCTDVMLYVLHMGARLIGKLGDVQQYNLYCGPATARMLLETMYPEFISRQPGVLHFHLLNHEHLWKQDAPLHKKIDFFLVRVARVACRMEDRWHACTLLVASSGWKHLQEQFPSISVSTLCCQHTHMHACALRWVIGGSYGSAIQGSVSSEARCCRCVYAVCSARHGCAVMCCSSMLTVCPTRQVCGLWGTPPVIRLSTCHQMPLANARYVWFGRYERARDCAMWEDATGCWFESSVAQTGK